MCGICGVLNLPGAADGVDSATLRGMADSLRHRGPDADEAYGERAAGFEDMRRRVPNADKLFEYTGFRPSISLDETLRQVIAYERERVTAATHG